MPLARDFHGAADRLGGLTSSYLASWASPGTVRSRNTGQPRSHCPEGEYARPTRCARRGWALWGLRHLRPPQPVVVLLGDFENLRALGILDDSGEKPELSLLSEHDPDMPWGEWVQGWYCGSPRAFLCVYWDAGKMWLGDAAGNHELHPSMDGEQLTLSVRGPRARFTFVGANGPDLTYRYMRTGAQILERNSYPDHELPRWLVEGWHGERGYFTRELKNGKLFRVGGSDSRASARGPG